MKNQCLLLFFLFNILLFNSSCSSDDDNSNNNNDLREIDIVISNSSENKECFYDGITISVPKDCNLLSLSNLNNLINDEDNNLIGNVNVPVSSNIIYSFKTSSKEFTLNYNIQKNDDIEEDLENTTTIKITQNNKTLRTYNINFDKNKLSRIVEKVSF